MEHTWTHLGCFWKLAKGAGVLFCPGDSEKFCINSSQGIWWTRYIFQANATSDPHLIFWTTVRRESFGPQMSPEPKLTLETAFKCLISEVSLLLLGGPGHLPQQIWGPTPPGKWLVLPDTKLQWVWLLSPKVSQGWKKCTGPHGISSSRVWFLGRPHLGPGYSR